MSSGRSSVPPNSSPSQVISAIEAHLRTLRAETETPGEPAKAHACTMNLVAVTGSETLTDRYLSVIDEVLRGVPARAIVVTLLPRDDENTLAGEVTAVHAVGGHHESCSDRVHLVARGAISNRIASAVYPLLVAELPTALVWLGPVTASDPTFISLASHAQRVVLDTEYTTIQSLLQVARWSRDVPNRPYVADLAWTRLAPWQEMCARFFDEPSLRTHAWHIDHLEIIQASEPRARLGSEGSLLLGWLATRLQWQAVTGSDQLVFQRPDGRYVTVTLGSVTRPSTVAPSALARVTMVCNFDGIRAKGTLVRQLGSGIEVALTPDSRLSSPVDAEPQGRRGLTADADVLVWHLDVPLPTATEQRVRLGANRGARLLERTLHRPANDPALNESVAFADAHGFSDLVVP